MNRYTEGTNGIAEETWFQMRGVLIKMFNPSVFPNKREVSFNPGID